MLRALVTGPDRHDQGGVAVYLGSVTKHFTGNGVEHDLLEIGSTKGRFLHPLADQLAFRRRIRRSAYDLVHINPSMHYKSFFRDGLLARQATSRGLPLVVFFHGWSDGFAEQVEERWLGFFKRTYGKADAFIVLASDFEAKLRKWGVTAPIYRETTAVSDDLIADFDLESKLANADVTQDCQILFLARLEIEKGVLQTIDAVSVLAKRGRNVQLVVAGDGPNAAEFRSYANKTLGDRVRFAGYVRGASKVKEFNNAHIYVLPTSHGEGLPVSVLEAMAFGLPVVTRPVGGLKDLFVEGKHGLMTETQDPADVANAIENLIKDRTSWQRLSRNVHSFAKNRFVASAIATKLAGIYRETVQPDDSLGVVAESN